MAKAKDAFRTISEVAEWLETPTHVLRFWESKFSQIKPVKGAGGRRYYRPTDMDLLGGIKHLLHEQGMTIKGTQKLLREKGVKHVASLGMSMTVPEPAPPSAEKPAAEPVSAKKATTPAPQQDTLPFGDHHVEDVPEIDWPPFPDEIDNLPARSFGVMSADALSRNAAEVVPLVARLQALRDRMQ